MSRSPQDTTNTTQKTKGTMKNSNITMMITDNSKNSNSFELEEQQQCTRRSTSAREKQELRAAANIAQ